MSDLLSVFRTRWCSATITRAQFLSAGVGLFLLKYAIDLMIARAAFHRGWSPWDYLVTSVPLTALSNLSHDAAFHLTLLGVAIPFIFLGVALTLARLRTVGLPTWLVILFFLPVLNLLFFLLLTVAPAVQHDGQSSTPVETESDVPQEPTVEPALPVAIELPYAYDGGRPRGLRGWLPENGLASMLVASLVPVPFGLLMMYVAVRVFRDYGMGVFVAMPFTQGVLAAAIHGARVRRSIGGSMCAAFWCGILTTIVTFSLAVEGLGCLIMLLPLAIPIMLIGGMVGYALQAGAHPSPRGGMFDYMNRSYLSLTLAVPGIMAGEKVARSPAPVYEATTCVEVDAPPAEVWKHVVYFGEIAPPPKDDWVFRMGVAYPVHATIDGRGPGAVRRCEFSTGPFIEPITVWDEPRRLAFDVTYNPPAMREWSPYDIHPPHVNDFLISHGGEFRLVPLDGGRRTRLEGTTWYEHNLWPASYWQIWSDVIIHRIHSRVLNHVKACAETDR